MEHQKSKDGTDKVRIQEKKKHFGTAKAHFKRFKREAPNEDDESGKARKYNHHLS